MRFMAFRAYAVLVFAIMLVGTIPGLANANTATSSRFNVIEVGPKQIQPYSHLEVRLVPPAGETIAAFEALTKAEILLEGEVAFATGEKDAAFHITLPATVSRSGRVRHKVDNRLEMALGLRHGIFTGMMTVRLGRSTAATDGTEQILWETIQLPVTLDIFPLVLHTFVHRLVSAVPLTPGASLGVQLTSTEQGLKVVGYTDAGFKQFAAAPEDRSLVIGDILKKVANRDVTTKTELSTVLATAVGRTGSPTLIHAIRDGTERRVIIDRVAAPGSSLPVWFWQVVAYILCASLILMGFFAPFAGITSYVERRIAGRIQSRIGPNRVGPGGFLQWLADGLKAIQKEDLIPPNAQNVFFRMSPYFVMAGVFLTFVHLPFSQSLVVADLDIGIFYILAVTSVVVVGIILGGWASNNKWSLLGGFRSAAQMVSYEIPLGLSVLSVVVITGSLSLQSTVNLQGGYPWEWNMFHNPALLAGFFIFFVSALAEGNRAPFDLPEAESELVSGYNTEYSGMRFVFFFFAEWANLYVISALVTVLFMGGWQIPGVTPFEMEASMGLQLLGLAILTLKAFALVFVIIWIRWTLPRIRLDQMMIMCWKYFIPVSFAGFMLTAFWITWVPQGVQDVVRYGLFGISVIVLALFLKRVRYNLEVGLARSGRFTGSLHY